MENKSLEESIIDAMEDNNINLIKYYPYILQDFWEIGTPSQDIIKTIKAHTKHYSNLSLLDLGSGKGAVSINAALELKCKCLGIDAMDEFVAFSNNKAKELSVNDICTFEKNDMRTRIKTLGKFDVIVLGAIGPVLGDYYNTLLQLKNNMNDDGIIIINDGYIEDGCITDYPGIFQKGEILRQINNAGMEIIDCVTDDDFLEGENSNELEVNNLEKRCMELIEKYPEDKDLFMDYIQNQKKLYEKLDSEVTSVIWVLKQKS